MTTLRVQALAGVAFCALSSVSSITLGQQIPPNANVVGAWSALASWPLIGIHAVLTPGGNVLTYGTDAAGKQTGKFIYDVWDPTAGGIAGGHMTLPNSTNTDIFCSAQMLLPQSGNVFIAGGDNFVNGATTNTGNSDANLFASANNSLSRAGSMNRARWYGSLTTLPNGETYIQGGSGGADRPEVRSAAGVFRLLAIDTNGLAWAYPRNFVAPDGRVFGFDTDGRMYFVSADLTTLTMAGTIPVTGGGSSAAMYAPGKILQIGGNSAGALTIDINGVNPSVVATASLASRRDLVNATVLANGNVLATGGSGAWNQLVDVNNSAAIWDPATGQWTVGPNGAVPRLYHSSALLLPDASVLVAGGGAPGPVTNTNAEIYYPPYLFNAAAGFAPRPSIVSTPTTIKPGVGFNVSVGAADAISRVTLVKTTSVTHSWNMDQRFIAAGLSQTGSTLTVTPPSNRYLTPPGYYLMFAINTAGVPSVAKIVNMEIPSSGSGNGLAAAYFNNVGLTGTPALQRAEAIDFDWGGGSPGAGVGVDNFSVRWTGQIEAPDSGSYQFQTVSDDGIRVYLNGQIVIDNWTDHAPTVNTSAAISLTAGSKSSITVEYYERGGGAVSRLQWKPPGFAGFVPVPADRLYSVSSGIDPNIAYSVVNQNSGKCLDIAGASTAENINVVQWTCHGGPNQKFKFTPTASGYYRLVAQHSGKVLRVSGGSSANGAKVLQTTWAGYFSQEWGAVSVGGGYYKLVNRRSSKVMDVPNCATTDGPQIQQWTDGNNACQAFRLQE
jgi:hypothetical protein